MSILTLSLLLLLSSLVLVPQQVISVECNKADKRTLLKIKAELGNPLHLASWNPAANCCSWDGVTCETLEGQVLDLEIKNANFAAPLPPSIGHLPVLAYLTLVNIPGLNGPIPPTFFNLTALKILTITNTAISGPVPAFLGRMGQLEILDLSCNQLSGLIPDTFSEIYHIDLSGNRLTGSIPTSLFAGSTSTPEVNLSRNQLTGGIPRSLGRINFSSVDLSRNGLTGDALFLFGATKWLARIDLSRNQLEFDMSGLGFPRGLVAMDLSYNRIRGRIPRSLPRLMKLESFDVSNNQLCGFIPSGRRMRRFGPKSYAGNKCLCGTPLPVCTVHQN